METAINLSTASAESMQTRHFLRFFACLRSHARLERGG